MAAVVDGYLTNPNARVLSKRVILEAARQYFFKIDSSSARFYPKFSLGRDLVTPVPGINDTQGGRLTSRLPIGLSGVILCQGCQSLEPAKAF